MPWTRRSRQRRRSPIVEPISNGLGSDAFAILWDGTRLHGLNSSGPAPATWTPDYFARKHGGQVPVRGWDAVTVPGAVAGWVELSRRFGKLPFADLMEPAIELAERGHGVGVIVSDKWARQVPLLQDQAGLRRRPSCRAAGHRRPVSASCSGARGRRCAASPRRRARPSIAAKSPSSWWRMRRPTAEACRWPTWLRFRPEWVDTISKDFAGHTLHEIPPNGQGIAALIALGMLEKLDIAGLEVDSVESQHLQIEAMKLAFADTYRWVADRSSMTQVTPEDLLDDGYLSDAGEADRPTPCDPLPARERRPRAARST